MKNNNLNQPSTLIIAQATYYPNQIKIFIPHLPFRRLALESSQEKEESDETFNENESNLERSIRRTKKTIRDYMLCNLFELFCTFTFKNNRQDIDEKKRQMSTWLHNQIQYNGYFSYLIIPEFHKDKKSLHFHGMFYGYCGLIKRAINPKTGREILDHNRPLFNLPEFTLGYSTAKLICRSVDDRKAVANYVTKYITKDMPVFHGKQRYWASKGLKMPIVEDNPEPWFENIKPAYENENDYGKTLWFNVGDDPIVDMFWEAHR